MVLRMGHKICFNGEIWLIIPKLSLLPLLIWSTVIFLQVKIPLPDILPQCVGLYDFEVDESKEKDCLPFKKVKHLNEQ